MPYMGLGYSSRLQRNRAQKFPAPLASTAHRILVKQPTSCESFVFKAFLPLVGKPSLPWLLNEMI
jgi:hypothetical protein